MTELNDKRLEAATEILKASRLSDEVEYPTHMWTAIHRGRALNLLDAALRVTGADELAEALDEALPILEEYGYFGAKLFDRAVSALAKYRELKNG